MVTMQTTCRWALALVAVGSCLTVSGQETPRGPDKSRSCESVRNLFHPTPRICLREMSTDRPDQTESPYTVDAGHFQLEMDFLNATFSHDYSPGMDVRTALWDVAPVNLKVGLLDNVDLQLVLDTHPYAHAANRISGEVAVASGFGDALTRVKINLWGNGGGKTAFAIMPFVKWPLPRSDLRNGKIEGGVILPFALELGSGWHLGAMTEFDFLATDAGRHRRAYVNSVTVGHLVSRRVSAYAEFFTVIGPSSTGGWQGQVDAGWTYAVRENVQLDLGCNFGVTRSAPKLNPFVGLSFRL